MDDLLTMEQPSGDEDGDNKNKSKLVGNQLRPALGRQWWWQLSTSWNYNDWMDATDNLTITLAPVVSVRHVILTKPRMQIYSMYSNDI